MKNILVALIAFQSTFLLFGQKATNCNWIDGVRDATNVECQLNLIKENFKFSNNSYGTNCDFVLTYYKYDKDETFKKIWNASDLDLFKSTQLDSIYIIDKHVTYDSKPYSAIVLNLNCDWLGSLTEINGLERNLQVLQKNFGKCGLVIADGIPVSSDTSGFHFVDVEKFISSIKPEEVESLNLLRGEAAKNLYGENLKNIVVIGFINDKVKYEVRKRVIEELKKKS